jgi:Uma2 family endonuclease
MSEVVRSTSFDAGTFYAWLRGQEHKHELVDGEPVMMAGANRRHDRVVANALRMIGNQLRGQPCQPFTGDTYIRIPSGNRHLPDLGVDCGPMEDESLEAADPKLVVDVTSPSTRAFDRTEKLEEYKTVASLSYVFHVDTEAPQVRVHRREPGGVWVSQRFSGLNAPIEIPELGLRLDLAELYEGLAFRSRLVADR